jgi:hypothetical protein
MAAVGRGAQSRRRLIGEYVKLYFAHLYFVGAKIEGVETLHHEHIDAERFVRFQAMELHYQAIALICEAHFLGLRANIGAGILAENLASFRFRKGDNGIVSAS